MENPFEEYGYKKNQEIFVDAEFILGVLNFCQRVQASQPKVAALMQYPKKVNEVRDKNGDLLRVDIEWEDHTAKSFANTAFTESGGVPIVPDLAMYAVQIQETLLKLHLDNINNGVAIKLKQDADIARA